MNIKALLDAEFFPFVIRPARYIGNEWGAVCPRGDLAAVRLALCVPAKYDRGMGYAEFHRLYRSLNAIDSLACERSFLPDGDAVELMRAKNIPLFALETLAPLSSYDWIHFLIPEAVCLPEMLTMLQLAGIPQTSRERDERAPLISASGIGRINPEPIADFLDFFLVGELDAEAASISATLSQRSLYEKKVQLEQLAKINGVYVPSVKHSTGPVQAVHVDNQKRLREITPIQAFEEVANDRLTVVLPPSFDIPRTVEAIAAAVQDTGYDELAISADLIAGVKNFDQFITSLASSLRDKRVDVVLPALPANAHALDYARAVSFGEKQSIRFNLKSGSERLREAHGHYSSLEQFYQVLANAYAGGWKTARLDFEIGLPEETDRDIDDLIDVIRNCESIRREYGEKTHLVVSLSPFAPMPFTQWQWDAMITPAEYQRRCEYVQRNGRGRNVQFKVRDIAGAWLNLIFARGGRSFATPLQKLSEIAPSTNPERNFNDLTDRCEQLTAAGLDLTANAAARQLGSASPWDSISYESSREQLLKLRQSAFPAIERKAGWGSFKLGDIILARPELAEQILVAAPATPTGNFGRRPKRTVSEPAPMIVPRSRVRVMWSKDDSVRYVGHLATMRVFERAIRRAELPVAFSQGFHQRPKLSFGPPLTLGYSSRGEFLDIQLDTPFQETMIARLNEVLPEGFRVLQGKPVFGKASSVSSLINTACYEVILPSGTGISAEKAVAVLGQSSIIVRRSKNDETNEIDVRNSILNIELHAATGVNLLYMELALGNRGFVRPDEVLSTCFGLSEREILSFKVCRAALLVTTGGSRLSPFEVSS